MDPEAEEIIGSPAERITTTFMIGTIAVCLFGLRLLVF
jgi:hypothetical protein